MGLQSEPPWSQVLPFSAGFDANRGIRSGELDMNQGANIKSIGMQVVMFLFSSFMVGFGAILGLVVPTWVLALFYGITGTLLWLLSKVMNFGPRILMSQVDLERFEPRPDERWLFVNG